MNILMIMCGGFLGAALRYGMSQWIPTKRFPLATFVVNMTGSFILGVCVGLSLNNEWYLFFSVGMLGAYTTFSTMSKEWFELINKGNMWSAIVYIIMVMVLSLGSTAIGMSFGIWL